MTSNRIILLFDGFYGADTQASNRKPFEDGGVFTRFTDFTPVAERVYVTLACVRAHERAHTSTATPFSKAVKSVNAVKPQEGSAVISPPRRKTGCKFYTGDVPGVVA